MDETRQYERWREILERIEQVNDPGTQAYFKQALPCFYKTYPIEPMHDESPPGISHIGGHPDLPAGTPWPVDGEGRPLPFLAQVNLSELEPGFAPYVPPKGWLYFFAVFPDRWGDIPHRVIYFDGSEEELRRAESPSQYYKPHRLRFETGFTLYGDMLDKVFDDHPDLSLTSREAGLLFDHFQGERTRLGGHPMSFQPLSEQHAYLKLSGFDDLYRYGTSMYSLESFIRREQLDAADPDLAAHLRTEVRRQIEEYRRDFAVHKQRMQSIRPIFVLGSEDDMQWGDLGFLQFFMHEDDLAKRDFSHTYCEVITT